MTTKQQGARPPIQTVADANLFLAPQQLAALAVVGAAVLRDCCWWDSDRGLAVIRTASIEDSAADFEGIVRRVAERLSIDPAAARAALGWPMK
jgi:hypothetical protein